MGLLCCATLASACMKKQAGAVWCKGSLYEVKFQFCSLVTATAVYGW